MLRKLINSLVISVLNHKKESAKLLELILKYSEKKSAILDVGCGYGRNLKLLKKSGITNLTGVEKNKHIIDVMLSEGFNCQDLDQIKCSSEKYDVIIMSHIIEHLDPKNLLIFMDEYLDKLKLGGLLIIATPILSDYFYDDFDHVKPYLPTGILNIFGAKGAQVQYYSKNKLELIDIWFRKDFHKLIHYRSSYIKSHFTPLIRILNILSALLFYSSFGIIGKVDGWVGVFRKSKSEVD